MIIAGGVYLEQCRYPHWDQLYGSGLRAAIAVSAISANTVLHSYVPAAWRPDVASTLSGFGIEGCLTESGQEIAFGYLHPFELVDEPEPSSIAPPINASGDVVLRFGMVEGDAVVTGRRVVFDPQSPKFGDYFKNGSKAEELALIVTPHELIALVQGKPDLPAGVPIHNNDIAEAIVSLNGVAASKPSVVLVKDKLGGLSVWRGDDSTFIESYSAESYFRIGSGDVLAAAFAFAWGEREMHAVDAADYAARAVSFFVEGPRLPLPLPEDLSHRRTSTRRTGGIRILSGAALEHQSLILHTRNWIEHLGGEATCEVSIAAPSTPKGAKTDLLLVGARATYAELRQLADVASNLSGVVYWPDAEVDTAARLFPGFTVVDDYATALYRALRV